MGADWRCPCWPVKMRVSVDAGSSDFISPIVAARLWPLRIKCRFVISFACMRARSVRPILFTPMLGLAGQNQVNHLNTSKAELMASVESMANGLTPSQTAASPSSSSSSFSISPPSLSPQAIAVSSSPVSSILSSSELPPSDPDCRDKRLRASGNDVEGEFPIPALSSPPDVSSGQEESNAVVCRNPSGDRVTDDERLLESKPASDRSKAGCGWLVAQGTQGSGSRAPSESDLSTNEDRG